MIVGTQQEAERVKWYQKLCFPIQRKGPDGCKSRCRTKIPQKSSRIAPLSASPSLQRRAATRTLRRAESAGYSFCTVTFADLGGSSRQTVHETVKDLLQCQMGNVCLLECQYTKRFCVSMCKVFLRVYDDREVWLS